VSKRGDPMCMLFTDPGRRQVLIELAPSYFRYIDSTASKASVLAKLMGFYTVEIKNLETGTVQAKHDLLVMENLFHNQKVAKTYDLKGIQSRRVKSNGDGTEQRTLFDGEWIEGKRSPMDMRLTKLTTYAIGQQRAPLLIQPHSKHILQEAIKADADFLAKSNIMDYSSVTLCPHHLTLIIMFLPACCWA
jgi:1-phosphatidylinositol-3-phosphate 5-kinase